MSDQKGLDDVSLTIHAVNISVEDDFRDRVGQALVKLRRYYSGDVITADVFLREEAHGGPDSKSLRISFGVPGTIMFAEDNGENWDALLNTVTGKLKHQLERHFTNSQNSYRQS
ncbi:HPF/RaiA family ribosome-associated protein [Spirosoma utsteinense]|uniref:Sigma-54 modulation protein n=1 Tax=Spirosoma utsteinense TaxID=2585773 RepID=A0ABR6W870_9BACT|nr:HPF/RaiA family ribosome-associated protein [Spirosoma utsteinense]MBC3785808.1 putative sigma-54 modulation protein [Spirosoma utsteinense]MBC3791980.1 putative sigma-54 modulation protein [Spirosoma utsteinense]